MVAATRLSEGVQIITENRRARMRYEVDERIEAGVVLVGSEVKSVRAGKMELGDAYAIVQKGELYLLNAYIAPWPYASTFKHEEKRTRKLLAHRAEIDRLEGRITQRGYTLIALKAYFKDGKIKVELGLARGKDTADRREEIKKREGDREARAAMTRAQKR
jgi:SsrA-binding protein